MSAKYDNALGPNEFAKLLERMQEASERAGAVVLDLVRQIEASEKLVLFDFKTTPTIAREDVELLARELLRRGVQARVHWAQRALIAWGPKWERSMQEKAREIPMPRLDPPTPEYPLRWFHYWRR